MKRSQIILFVVVLVISGLIYVALASNKKEFSKETKEGTEKTYVAVREVKHKLKSLSLVSYGQVTPNIELIVSFEVQGKLIRGAKTMKPGTNFSRGQLLYSVDSEEAFHAFNAAKSTLMNQIVTILPDIELDYPSERDKWVAFLNGLSPGINKRLPEFPKMGSREGLFITSRNIPSQYFNLKSQEKRLDKYRYIAPFSGTVVATFAEPGSIVNPGIQVAKIAKTGDFEIKVPISMEDIELYKDNSTADFIDASGKKVATGKIVRVSNVINQQTQSADVYYSVKALKGETVYNGMYLNVSIEKEAPKRAMTIPRAAMRDGKVQLLEKGKVKSQEVIVVGSKPDSLYITGLTDGQLVLLEQVEVEKKMKYEGIKR